MIEFILSKFGILLFAVSVAGILLVFGANMKDVFVADEGMQISSILSKQLKEMADSESLCVSRFVTLPKYIDVFGANETSNATSLYYFMDINVVNSNYLSSSDDRERKLVVFTLVDKRSKRPLSLESFISDADVQIIGEGEGYQYTEFISDKEVRIDPTETNVIYMVKVSNAIKGGGVTKKLFFIPCKYDKGAATPLASCFIELKKLSQEENAYCVPTGDPYDITRTDTEVSP